MTWLRNYCIDFESELKPLLFNFYVTAIVQHINLRTNLQRYFYSKLFRIFYYWIIFVPLVTSFSSSSCLCTLFQEKLFHFWFNTFFVRDLAPDSPKKNSSDQRKSFLPDNSGRTFPCEEKSGCNPHSNNKPPR